MTHVGGLFFFYVKVVGEQRGKGTDVTRQTTNSGIDESGSEHWSGDSHGSWGLGKDMYTTTDPVHPSNMVLALPLPTSTVPTPLTSDHQQTLEWMAITPLDHMGHVKRQLPLWTERKLPRDRSMRTLVRGGGLTCSDVSISVSIAFARPAV